MNTFILAWVLITAGNSYKPDTYSPPVKTLEDCQKMQVFDRNTKCVQVNILVTK